MRFRSQRVFFVLALLSFFYVGLFGVTSVFAEDASESAQTTTTVPAPSEQGPVSFSYFGTYVGPQMIQPLNKGSVNTTTLEYDEESPVYLNNQFKLDINLTSNLFVGPVVNFDMVPVAGKAFRALDSGIRIGHRNLIGRDDLSLMADLRVMVPLKKANRDNDEVVNLQSLQILTYKVPHTKLSLGFLGFHYYQIYGSNVPTRDPSSADDPKDLTLYLAPNIAYQFTETLAGVVYAEFYPYHLVGADASTFVHDPMDISPGVSWDVTPNFNVSPQLLLYPSRLAMDTVGTIVYLSATFL